MAFMAGNIKSLLSVKIKARHDSYTDQVSRILVAKVFIVASLVMGVDWFHDTVNCVLPKNSDLKDDYIHSACWIQGFYIYPALGGLMQKSSHYGIPKDITVDGMYNGTNSLCSVKDKYHYRNRHCVLMQKHYFAQYQWMPFFVASLSLFFYLPYIIFRAVNTDLISLRDDVKGPHNLVATDIIYNYFDHNINPKSKMRWRIVLNFFIKLIYVFINVLTFYLMNVFLNSHFKTYGRDWTNWANENTSYAMNFNIRVLPTPGNQMLPTFGLCDIHESQADSTTSYGNQHKILCEISSNILYQYVFLVLWFVLVFSITVSIIGIFLNIYAHIVSAAIFVKNDKSAKYVYRFLTFRECEYLEYIRRKNLRLYGDVIRLLREMKLQHLTLAFESMQDGLKKIGAQCASQAKAQAKAQGIESATYDSNGYTYDELAAEYGESFDDTFDTEFATNEPKPTFTRSVSDKMNNLKNKFGENNPKINRIPLVRRYVGANANTNKVKKHGGGGGGKRR